MSYKIDSKSISRDKEGHFTMIKKGSIHWEDMTILIMYSLKIRFKIHEAKRIVSFVSHRYLPYYFFLYTYFGLIRLPISSILK